MSIQSRRIIIFFFLTINLSYKVRQKDINIEELAQFEKTRQGFGGAAPNKLEVQGVARSSAKRESPGGAGAVSFLNTNDKGVFLLCKQKSHCFGTALSLSASQMAHEFEQDAT